MRYFLANGTPPEGLNPKQRRALRLKAEPYQIIQGILFRSNREGVLLRCLEKEDSEQVLEELHQGQAGGHFGGDTTAHKVLRAGYYWPTLFKDSHAITRRCIKCQKCAGRFKKAALPLQPVMVEEPFQQWGLDVIGPITLSSLVQHKCILTATDYFTIWAEAIPLRVINSNQVVSFLNSNIISRFGLPEVLVFDNASYFNSADLTEFALDKGIKLRYSSNYYPQGNGLSKSTNKNLVRILKKTINDHHRNWHTQLINALWSDRVTPKAAIGNSPFFLVYGKEVILPPNLFLPSLQLSNSAQQQDMPTMTQRINLLLKLEEERNKTKHIFSKHQSTIKRWFDSHKSTE